jgi:hypothetical protein
MKWKSEEMLAAYQHYFDEQRHAESQKQFHTRLHAEVQQYLAEQHHRSSIWMISPLALASVSCYMG